MTDQVSFDSAFRQELHRLLRWRRDVRHFRREPLPVDTLPRLLAEACLAPSVGLSEPWRFVLVDDAARRAAIRANFETSNADALSALQNNGQQSRAQLYARLKLAGLDDAPVHLAVFCEPDPEQGHGLGRKTMPETLAYSTVMAIHTFWLAARAEGVGVGWVSILDPEPINAMLDVPAHWQLIGYLCVGYPVKESETPELEEVGWDHARRDAGLLHR
ncbi:Nitroreductase family protein [Granulibacter bethesdensis]|uniref:Nitroreductase family protein n=1 Tax=Granulibacter bethesdensis TaxID=364410 RepID=A0AAC9P8A9_9PROT|nr:5,6-dimethylbenzimidazole synthase [Granulibacter bethesdensis]APH54381.1 Nitroreductase family protein [Granulibacter bethesdensis]APH61966.1 Nitroreductase family protein [Granulibacter bethesdensis]